MVKSSNCFDNKEVKKGAWSEEEDNKLRAYIHRYGHWNWSLLPKFAGVSRSGKSCRLRWMNYLRPNMKHGNFTIEEDDLIIELHNKLGNKWSKIAATLPGRSDNEIKNRWNTHLKKRSQNALKRDHANPNENPFNKTDLDYQQEVVSSESFSYSSRTEASTDCAVLSDFTPNTFDEELGNFWTEPFLQDNDEITPSEENLLPPYNFVNECCLITSECSCLGLMMTDECLWSTMDAYIEVYNMFIN